MPDSAVADAPATDSEARSGADQPVAYELDLQEAGPSARTLVFTVSEEEIARKIESTYGNLADDAVLPGFRKGRAPRKLLERKFASSIRGDVKQQIISEAYTRAIEDHKLDVLGEPEVRDMEKLELPESGSFGFSVDVEVTPDVKLPDFSSITVERPERTIDDAGIDAEVGRIADQLGSVEPAEEGFTTQEGDYVTSHLVIRKGENAGDDAEAVLELPEAYTLLHGEDKQFKGHIAGIVVQDMGQRLMGKQKGHVERISMTGPPSHENAGVRDQPVTLVLTVLRAERSKAADLDTLVERAGFETEAELRDRVRDVLVERAAGEQRQALHKQVADFLLENVELDLPSGLRDRQIERNHERLRMLALMGGKSEAEAQDELAEARAESEDEAIRQLKAFFIVDAAAKELEVDVAQNELNTRIYQMAMSRGIRFDKLRQEMGNRGEIEQLYLSIREGKTLDKILEAATITGADSVAPAPEGPATDESQEPAAEPAD